MVVHDIFEIIEDCDYYTHNADAGYCSCRDCPYFRNGVDNHTTYEGKGRCLITEIFGNPPWEWNMDSVGELYGARQR